MSTIAPMPAAADDAQSRVRQGFDRLKAGWRAQKHTPTLGEREADLEKIAQWSLKHSDAICEALDKDFGGRSSHETLMGEVWFCINGIRHTQKHLKRWMRPEKRPMLWVLRPATARVMRQPVGVVGIIAPWNYPWQLAVAPLTAALAAGNRIYLKPSELTPHTSAILGQMIGELFEPDQVAMVEGDADVGAAFSALPFDHLLFTGSTKVGRYVLQAAAPNLTPVTLELGGKSPVVIHPSYNLDTAATRIAFGKCFSAGQTCIAPDYVLIEKDRIPAFVQAMKTAVQTLYPTMGTNPDYTAIANETHEKRLRRLVSDAEAAGATAEWLHPEGDLDGTGKFGPVCVLNATEL
ncbi:MAG: aldehyde dehydrogenase family protein, partial [Myxococcota bacterium]